MPKSIESELDIIKRKNLEDSLFRIDNDIEEEIRKCGFKRFRNNWEYKRSDRLRELMEKRMEVYNRWIRC